MKTTPLTAKRLLSLTLLAVARFIPIVVLATPAVSSGFLSPMVWKVREGSAGSQPPQDHKRGNQDLAMWLELPAEVPAGSPVPIRLKVKNIGDHTINLPLGGRPAHDVVVTRQDGTELWRWRQWRGIQHIIVVRRLLPGEELAFDAEWLQQSSLGIPVPPGTYLVQGVLRLRTQLRAQLETEPKPLRIMP